MKHIIRKRCLLKIMSFYRNVSKKYKQTLLRREPTLERWKGYYMANTDKWYFAYTIEGDTITIVDACHAQNMHNKR